MTNPAVSGGLWNGGTGLDPANAASSFAPRTRRRPSTAAASESEILVSAGLAD
jgi:hypothetical protein